MKNKNTGLLYLIAITFLVFLSSCNDETQTTDLNLTFVDDKGSPIENATVSLYANKNDWTNATNPIRVETTVADGSVVFTDLESKIYYIEGASGNLNNWSTTIESIILEANVVNELDVELNDSHVNTLVGKTEKSYRLTDLRFNGFSLFGELESCEKDNVFFFQRDDFTGVENTSSGKCTPDEKNELFFTWKFSSDESLFFIDYIDGDALEYKVISIGNSKMTFETEIDLEGEMVPVEVDFEVL